MEINLTNALDHVFGRENVHVITDATQIPVPDPAVLAAKQIAELLRFFIPERQLAFIRDLCKGEEGQFFYDKLTELHTLISAMPGTYEQDGKGDAAMVYLHYFGGSGDWYITEKDKGSDEEWSVMTETGERKVQKGEQWQAFGLADLGYGGEFGYIPIQELLAIRRIEIDLHFTPRTLAKLKTDRPRHF